MAVESDTIFDIMDVGEIHASHLSLTNDHVAASILTLATVIFTQMRKNNDRFDSHEQR